MKLITRDREEVAAPTNIDSLERAKLLQQIAEAQAQLRALDAGDASGATSPYTTPTFGTRQDLMAADQGLGQPGLIGVRSDNPYAAPTPPAKEMQSGSFGTAPPQVDPQGPMRATNSPGGARAPDADVESDLSGAMRRLFVNEEEKEDEPEQQAPQPAITASMRRPNGRILTEYSASKPPGAKGYVIVGKRDANLMVSGARRVGQDKWYVPPGAVVSVVGRPGAYTIRSATNR